MLARTFAFAFATTTLAAFSASAQEEENAPTQVVVHLANSRAEVVLETRDGEGAPWIEVCSGGCDRALDLDATYRINGRGVHKSKPFHLDGEPGEHITLDVHAGSSGAFAGGIALTAVGSFFLAGGTALTALSTAGAASCAGANGGCGFGGIFVFFGYAISAAAVGIGLGTFIPGVVMLANNTSSVREPVGEAPFVRTRDESKRADPATWLMPTITPIPIFRTTF